MKAAFNILPKILCSFVHVRVCARIRFGSCCLFPSVWRFRMLTDFEHISTSDRYSISTIEINTFFSPSIVCKMNAWCFDLFLL